MNSLWAIVPYKEPPCGKTRLSSQFTIEQRVQLASIMLEDVITTLQQANSVEGILLVSDSINLERFVAMEDVIVLATETKTLKAAITKASSFASTRLNCSTTFVIPADVPLITTDDIEYAVSQHQDITIIPDARMKGTNGVIATPPNTFDYEFNGESLRAHQRSARRSGRSCNTLQIENISYDVDTINDLIQIAQLQPESRIAKIFWSFAKGKALNPTGNDSLDSTRSIF